MRVHVHETDLPTEERCGLRSLKQALHATLVGHRPIEQAHPVRPAEVSVDDLQMLTGLRRSQQVLEDRVNHRQRAVPDPRPFIAGVQQVACAPLVEDCVARKRSSGDQETLEILLHGGSHALESEGFALPPNRAQRPRKRRQHLEVQRHCPGAAHVIAHCRVDGLQ